eukprot:945317-Rhodomonas_salina.2
MSRSSIAYLSPAYRIAHAAPYAVSQYRTSNSKREGRYLQTRMVLFPVMMIERKILAYTISVPDIAYGRLRHIALLLSTVRTAILGHTHSIAQYRTPRSSIASLSTAHHTAEAAPVVSVLQSTKLVAASPISVPDIA